MSREDQSTRGGGRTHTTRERQGILSPPRMPFRHPGIAAILEYLSIFRFGLSIMVLDSCVNRRSRHGAEIGGFFGVTDTILPGYAASAPARLGISSLVRWS